MFKLSSATVHYGSNSYDLYGLEHSYEFIESPEDLDVEALARVVGLFTGFPREFTKTHCARMEFTMERDGIDLVIPEKIVALANGYTITWVKI